MSETWKKPMQQVKEHPTRESRTLLLWSLQTLTIQPALLTEEATHPGHSLPHGFCVMIWNRDLVSVWAKLKLLSDFKTKTQTTLGFDFGFTALKKKKKAKFLGSECYPT